MCNKNIIMYINHICYMRIKLLISCLYFSVKYILISLRHTQVLCLENFKNLYLTRIVFVVWLWCTLMIYLPTNRSGSTYFHTFFSFFLKDGYISQMSVHIFATLVSCKIRTRMGRNPWNKNVKWAVAQMASTFTLQNEERKYSMLIIFYFYMVNWAIC